MNDLYIVRGLPGSGKTTLARSLTPIYFEADMYFVNENGVYEFNRDKLKEAHTWCQMSVEYVMNRQAALVVVSNTFVKRWEMEPYIHLAATYGYRVTEITMSGKLFPSIHDVPDETIERMRAAWER